MAKKKIPAFLSGEARNPPQIRRKPIMQELEEYGEQLKKAEKADLDDYWNAIDGVINFPPKVAKIQPKQFQKGDLVMIIKREELEEGKLFYYFGPLEYYNLIRNLLAKDRTESLSTCVQGAIVINKVGKGKYSYEFNNLQRYSDEPPVLPDKEFARKLYDAIEEQASAGKYEKNWKFVKHLWNWNQPKTPAQ